MGCSEDSDTGVRHDTICFVCELLIAMARARAMAMHHMDYLRRMKEYPLAFRCWGSSKAYV